MGRDAQKTADAATRIAAASRACPSLLPRRAVFTRWPHRTMPESAGGLLRPQGVFGSSGRGAPSGGVHAALIFGYLVAKRSKGLDGLLRSEDSQRGHLLGRAWALGHADRNNGPRLLELPFTARRHRRSASVAVAAARGLPIRTGTRCGCAPWPFAGARPEVRRSSNRENERRSANLNSYVFLPLHVCALRIKRQRVRRWPAGTGTRSFLPRFSAPPGTRRAYSDATAHGSRHRL